MKHRLFLSGLLFLLFLSCRKEKDQISQDNHVPAPSASQPPAQSNAFYPLAIGHQWKYLSNADYIIPNHNLHYTFYTTQAFTADTVLGIYDSVYVQVTRDSSATGDIYFSRNYYMLTDTGLFTCGYIMGTSPRVFLRSTHEHSFEIAGLKFNSLQHLTAFFSSGNSMMADSLIIESPPRPTLKKPLVLNEVWAYREYTSPFYIGKKYTGNETVVTNFGSFSCKKIQWLYDFNNDSIPDPDITITQFFSPDKGLLKVTQDFYDISISDSTGVYTGDVHEISIATAVNF